MEAGIIWMIVIVAVLFLLTPLLFRYIIPALYWFIATAVFLIFFALDQLFSASLIPSHPWLMWVIWGAVIGAALGFWSLAPVYGLRNQRKLIALAPFALMAIVIIVRTVCATAQ